MDKQTFMALIISVLLILMLFFNKKVSLLRLFISQIKVFKSAKTKKYSFWDFLTFLIFPIIISIIIVCGLSYRIDDELASILTTVFSLFFTILFGFAAVIVEKSENDNPKKEKVIGETFVSIVTATILSLVAAIISIFLTIVNSVTIISVLSSILISLSINIVMLLLMITKRTFVIYCE